MNDKLFLAIVIGIVILAFSYIHILSLDIATFSDIICIDGKIAKRLADGNYTCSK